MLKAVGYFRVSSADQEDRGTIQLQLAQAPRWCEANGYELVGEYRDEDVSGTIPLPERPAGAQLLLDAPRLRASGVSLILLYAWSRIGRKPYPIWNAIHLLEDTHGFHIRSMTESADTSTPEAVLMLCVQTGFATYQREELLRKMREAKRLRAGAGQWVGGPPPLGYRVEGQRQTARLVVDDNPLVGVDPAFGITPASLVQQIFLWTTEGVTLNRICERMETMGIPSSTARNGKWCPRRVQIILDNPAYYGEYHWGRKQRKGARPLPTVPYPVPPLVSRELWEEARERRKRNLILARRNCRHDYLLRGLIRCGECGRTYHARTVYPPTGEKSYRGYTCSGRGFAKRHSALGICTAGDLNGKVDDWVWEKVEGMLADPGTALVELKARQEKERGDKERREEQRAAHQEAIQRLLGERQIVIGYGRQGIITHQELESQLAELRRGIEGHELLLRELEEPEDAEAAVRLAEAEVLLQRIKEQIGSQSLSFAGKREIVEILVRSVTARITGKGWKREQDFEIAWTFD